MNTETKTVRLALNKNPKFVEFLTTAYNMPSEIRLAFIDMFDNVDMRNAMMVIACYLKYREEVYGEDVEDFEAFMKKILDIARGTTNGDAFLDMDNFLAYAVKRKFGNGYEVS